MEKLKTDDISSLLQSPNPPKIYEQLIDQRIEMMFEVVEPSGEKKYIWFEGVIVALYENGSVDIEWDDVNEKRSNHKLKLNRYNRYIEEGWRFHCERKIIT